MQFSRKSPVSGKINVLEIDVTEEQLAAYKRGVLIQDAMPNVPGDLREFIMTGITPEEWKGIFDGSVD